MVSRRVIGLITVLVGFAWYGGAASAQSAPITPEERKLCIDVCFKQLTCAGMAGDRDALNSCSMGCEQALALRDPFTSKPWYAAASCVDEPCGTTYNTCVTNKLSEPSKAERECEPICRKRLECNGQGADISARQECMRSCVLAVQGPDSPQKAFEQATGQCLKKSCGLDLEVCVAKELGGDNAICARACEGRLKCQKAETAAAFAQCMPHCMGELAQPVARSAIEAEITCRGCGVKQQACIAKRLGGNHVICHRVCEKQLTCGGAGDNVPALIQCSGSCLQVMATGSPAQQVGFTAIDQCRRKRCGDDFNQCVAKGLGQVAQPRPAVQPQPSGPSPAERRCQQLCGALESCTPGAGGTSCMTRCMADRDSDREFDAIERCTAKGCGANFEACVLARMRVSRRDRACAAVCHKELSCRDPGSVATYTAIANCARGCRRSKLEIAAAEKCAERACGAEYDACFAEATKKPPTRAELRCQRLCDKATECASFAGGEACLERCLDDREARREFIFRERCSKRSCGEYDSCMLDQLKVSADAQKCVPACRHSLSCSRQGGGQDILAVAACASSCTKSPAELQAIAACADAGCDTAFDTCVKYKLEAMAAEAPKEPEMSPEEKRCRAICDKAAECVSGSGGDVCVAQCVQGKTDRAELRARESCETATCDDYDGCVLAVLGAPKSKLACKDACRHEVSCRPPGEPRDLKAVVACVRGCDKEPREIEAIGACAVKGCGRAFDACVLEKSGRMAEIEQVKGQCEALCAKAGECRKGSGGEGCVRRCLEGGPASVEYKVRHACKDVACGEAYDTCLLDRLRVPKANHRCLAACRWDLSCERGNQSGDLVKLETCLTTCRYTEQDLVDRSYCEPEGCGSGFEACLERRAAEAKKAPEPPPAPNDAAASRRCTMLCERAETCEPGSGGKACIDRCSNDKAAPPEFAARQKCGGKACAAYGQCVLTELGLKPTGERCVSMCRKTLECGGGATPMAVVDCANQCKADDAALRAARACADAACGEAYESCVAEKSKEKTITPEERRCQDLCAQAERCTPGTGGDSCVERCLSDDEDSQTEFKIREKCTKNDCKGYDACMMKEILGDSDTEDETPPKQAPAPKKDEATEPEKAPKPAKDA